MLFYTFSVEVFKRLTKSSPNLEASFCDLRFQTLRLNFYFLIFFALFFILCVRAHNTVMHQWHIISTFKCVDVNNFVVKIVQDVLALNSWLSLLQARVRVSR